MKPMTEKEFRKFVEFIKNGYGVNLSQKKTLMVGRLQNFLEQNGFQSFSDYYDYVVGDKSGNASGILINKLTTNHTFFLREAQHFEYLKNTVLPYLSFSEARKKDLRIWSAGCSSGEEPYTLAMLLDEYFGLEKESWDTKILATDISTKVLQHAAEGIYNREEISVLPDKWIKKYFDGVDHESSRVRECIRKEVIYRKFNLMEEVLPFKKKFHVIFCRNVMIYFDAPTKNALVERFYDMTEPGGYLFIGHSESLSREDTRYKYILPAIYRKE